MTFLKDNSNNLAKTQKYEKICLTHFQGFDIMFKVT